MNTSKVYVVKSCVYLISLWLSLCVYDICDNNIQFKFYISFQISFIILI